MALDLIMHHMGRKIDLAWPNKRAVLNVHLFQTGVIAVFFPKEHAKGAAIGHGFATEAACFFVWRPRQWPG
jgi:hypothetical protein